ncbi:hypothetical protein WR25_26573 [Diploscapter pachys]|uniref:Uncharacterized protein n=1 Tax=Diploscapter pachys TaxID=2018661 RepID=A0A2A2KCR2_9BILA|nr:hypothetical protein WR25_26573 [Diploscapter pachys]
MIINKLANLTQKDRETFFWISNFILLVCGVVSFIIGIWMYIEKSDFAELTPASYSAMTSAGICAFTGASMCIICIIGCLVVWFRSKIMLITYVAFIIILGITQLLITITGLFNTENAQEFIRKDLLKNINSTHVLSQMGHKVELRITWDHMQETLQCCGVDRPDDWFYSKQWPNSQYVPDSCCNITNFASENDTYHCGMLPENRNLWHQQGCYPVFIDWLFHHIYIITWLAVVLVIVEIIVLIASILIWKPISEFHRIHQKRNHRRRLVEEANEELRLNPMDRIGNAANEPESVDQIT